MREANRGRTGKTLEKRERERERRGVAVRAFSASAAIVQAIRADGDNGAVVSPISYCI